MFLLKKPLYIIAFIVLVVVLALAISPSKAGTSFVQKSAWSMTEFKKHSDSFGVLVKINQATNFNHLNQTSFDYIFVALIALFLVSIVNYQWFKPTILPLPWHISLKHKSRITISGFKMCNLQYKAQSSCQH